MNNNFFALTRFLRDKGYDARLFLLSEDTASHFMPEADTFSSDHGAYTTTLNWGDPSRFRLVDIGRIRADLAGFDVIIGCGSAPGFLAKAGIRMDIVAPYGFDIYGYPFFRLVKPRNLLDFWTFAPRQKEGIRDASYLCMDITNEDFEQLISRIGIRGTRVQVAVPFLYTPLYNPTTIQKYFERSRNYEQFAALRQHHDFIVFHHARHIWKTIPNRYAYKGNDKLVRGFADFVRMGISANPCLILFEYGLDVARTKELVAELGIQRHVTWFPQIPRKEIMVGLYFSDVGAGEFGMSWLSYGVIYEIMAMGKPVMHYREDDLYLDAYPELYPMYHAHSTEEITRELAACARNPEEARNIGEAGRVWFEKYAVTGPLQKYMEIIERSRR